MVIYYDENGRIDSSNDYPVMSPVSPAHMTMEEKIAYYKSVGLNFVCLNYEIGIDIFNYKAMIDEQGNFSGLQPIQREV